MNETIRKIQDHRSIRNFLDQEISEETINEILKSAQAMPNSINGQQTSVIVVKDKVKKAEIAKLAGGQKWIDDAPVFLVFIADFYKTDLAAQKNDRQQIAHESVEGILAGAVDVGINLGAAIIAAESLGLGIVPIGGIRRSPDEMITLLDLPQYTFPMAGLAMGYPSDHSHQKPRLPLNTFRHDETYHTEGLRKTIDEYDEQMKDYLKEIGREQEGNWSKATSNIYQMVYYPKVYPVLKDQGFKNDK
ncbi:NADPH-dependent oxidoreductase [Acetobacterium woodii]|uniref:NADPH-flavin oxidoreductase YcnD n=1 Tax=Acetobacterium woodii (strain ATCC 29683 / DSM 1030 / JCM 2381 / KCTC 1655 / WB1) TaxID=931626 RepID=H6LJH8_ACEWD|nr:NADPH-dependent oxidoreductase [Acetobacterium woodii]AFA49906.1 NADPH-flavin oxidoreductase YcnD [Acetobacterium woodii DSM 1030]